ncbi:MAG: ice-binding family protein [Candidatus Woesearchaeota archaeon]
MAVNEVSAATSPSLGAASTFAVLAATPGITNVPTSAITGNVGLSPATGAGIGLTCVEVTGTIYSVDAAGPLPCRVTNPGLLTNAQAASTAAFAALSAVPNVACDVNYGAVTKDLVGLTLVPGVYCANAFGLSGTLTLDDTGNAAGVWIFRTTAAAAALTTTPGVGAKVQFLNGIGSLCNVWWKVASSATIGSGTAFIGNIMALTSISLGTGASLNGRALAQTGAITLDANQISNVCGANINGTNITSLTVKKIVINDNGGTAHVSNFTLLINGSSVLSGIANVVAPGSYVVSEIGVSGYNGTITGDCSPSGMVTLTMGQNKTCTITNNDVPSPPANSPKLTVNKIVINDNGGTKNVSNFTLKVGSVIVVSGVQNTFIAGTYIVSEVLDPMYSVSFGGACSINGRVVLHAGDVKTCTITNNDIPSPKPIPVMGDKLFILLIAFTLILGLYGFKRYSR